MFPILASIISQAANLANKNLSELKASGRSSGPSITQAASLAQDIAKQTSTNNPVE